MHYPHKRQGGDVKSRLLPDLIVEDTATFDDDNTFQAGQVMALVEPSDIADNRDVTGHEARMIGMARQEQAAREA